MTPPRIPALSTLLMLLPLGAQPPQERMNIAVNDADLKDILRAATADTDFNLIFEPGLETRVQGLSLKATGLQELLDEVLPRLGLACTRQGRNLYIQRGEGGLRFYHLDQLAVARTGSKSFQVNASGQVAGSGGTGGSSASGGAASGSGASAYTSTVQVENASDPWTDVESGLMLLVFGRAPAAPDKSSVPGSRGFTADGKSLLIQPNSGLVMVNADAATHRKVEAFLRETRQRTQRQVLLEARIVEVTLGNDSQMGMDWGGLLSGAGNPARASFDSGPVANANVDPSQGLLKIVGTSGRVQATLTALARDQRLKVLSSPRLSTLNNQKAVLRVVREEAYGLPVSQITPGTAAGGAVATGQVSPLVVPVGIVLDILPQIGDDGYITLSVNPSISEVVSERTFPVPGAAVGSPQVSAKLPVVDRRDLDAVVRVRSGETLVLAGIIRNRETADNRGVPWVRKIPLIGALFAKNEKSRLRTELAIFITASLMEEPAQVDAQRAGTERRLGEGGVALAPPPPPAKLERAEP